jgi:glucose-6-phosphate 1-dehydrogenase
VKNFILLGASGDLAFEKIYPALMQLYAAGIRFDNYVGFARSDIENFSEKIESRLEKDLQTDAEIINAFSDQWEYIRGVDYSFEGVSEIAKKHFTKTRDVENTYYLALPIIPELIEDLLASFKKNHLISSEDLFVFEKPFGRDYKSAGQLSKIISNYLKENQIWMVDHYLGKNMVRNIISLRFANPIFEAVWDKKYIDRIEIKATEQIGVKGRGKYYDKTGAIRDMVQNHLLQVLALVTMHSDSLSKETFSKAKIEILNSLKIYKDNYSENLSIKQYDGYTDEPYVDENSFTETYAKLIMEVEDKRWDGVPIKILTGKKLERKCTTAEIFFRKNKNCVWGTKCNLLEQNKLTINIAPDPKVDLEVNSGFSPMREIPESVELSFNLGGLQDEINIFSSPYANVLKDIYRRDFLYAITLDEVLASWKAIDKVIEHIDNHRNDLLKKY